MEKEKAKLPQEFLLNKSYVFDQLLESSENKEWYWNELQNAGPDHKKVLTSILLSSVDKLVQKVEAKKHTKFEPQDGVSVTKEYTTGKEMFPINAILGNADPNIKEIIASAPDHELLVYLAALQAIDWVTRSI